MLFSTGKTLYTLATHHFIINDLSRHLVQRWAFLFVSVFSFEIIARRKRRFTEYNLFNEILTPFSTILIKELFHLFNIALFIKVFCSFLFCFPPSTSRLETLTSLLFCFLRLHLSCFTWFESSLHAREKSPQFGFIYNNFVGSKAFSTKLGLKVQNIEPINLAYILTSKCHNVTS